MKKKIRFLSMMIALMTFLQCTMFFPTQILAHSATLDVVYDACDADPDSDDINEMWYALESNSVAFHISHEATSIRYYFADSHAEGLCTWDEFCSESEAEDIKAAFARSMEKWNNVFFYSYDSSGKVVKRKIIDICEGSAEDHDITIYPCGDEENDSRSTIYTVGNETGAHRHISQYNLYVNVYYFSYATGGATATVNALREKAGAHEIGHILGLKDIDNVCSSGNNAEGHHKELLMGYGGYTAEQCLDITYKDIAGVAITRGFHTDADHMWLHAGQTGNKHKLICSVCNGVKYVSNLTGYSYSNYNSCNNNHNLSSNNMMAVASYGKKDYYKCKYCRYVAPFSNIVQQNTSIGNQCDVSHHEAYNNVAGLAYTFVELHKNTYTWQNYLSHRSVCECGSDRMDAHVVLDTDTPPVASGKYMRCLLCKGDVSIGSVVIGSVNELPHTENGSYQLPSGVIVLVEEDVRAYLEGSLVFYTGERA